MSLALLLGPAPAEVRETPPEIKPAIATAIGDLLQADGPSALSRLAPLDPEVLSDKDRRLVTCAPARLTGSLADDPVHEDAGFDQRALALYRAYWRAALMAPSQRERAEADLIAALAELLDRPDLAEDAEAVGEAVIERIKAEGSYALGGRTGRLLDLMLWADQTEQVEDVPLPEGAQSVRVHYLDGFSSRGWSHYVTCGRAATGGWAKQEGLYAIVPAYERIDDPTFVINFLTHEAQHYADYGRFPDLEGWALEVRAKLAELAMADQDHGLILNRFKGNQGDDPADSHAYANRLVLRALDAQLGSEDLASLDGALIKAAARAELLADSQRRSDQAEPTAP